jgi:hypothetical protein
MRSCDYHIWNCIKKCCLMIPISSYLSNLPNPAIYEVMWPSYLKSHEKMLPNDTHIILFEQPTQSGNILSHVTTMLNTHQGWKYWCHQKANLEWQGSWGATCLIEQVIPPRIDSAHTYQMRLLRHRNVHWTILETISDEFEASEAMCCNKRHQVAEKSCNPDWEFSFYVPGHPQMAPSPI